MNYFGDYNAVFLVFFCVHFIRCCFVSSCNICFLLCSLRLENFTRKLVKTTKLWNLIAKATRTGEVWNISV